MSHLFYLDAIEYIDAIVIAKHSIEVAVQLVHYIYTLLTTSQYTAYQYPETHHPGMMCRPKMHGNKMDILSNETLRRTSSIHLAIQTPPHHDHLLNSL